MEKANYYILSTEVEDDEYDAILEGYNNKYLRRIDISFSKGINLPVNDILEVIEFQIAEYALRGRMTDHLSIDGINGFVFSDKIKELFQKNDIQNIEYFQLHLIDEYDEEEKIQEEGYLNYSIANI